MRLQLHLKTAIRNLTSSPLRSFLAMLGIMVGTASVVALMSGGSLATQAAVEQIKTLGTDLMRIDFNDSSFLTSTPIDINKILDLRTSIPGILLVAPVATSSSQVAYQNQLLDGVSVFGTNAELAEIINIQTQIGRFIHPLDKAQPFCVVGDDVSKKLKTLYPIKENLKLDNGMCRIIGVAKRWPENNIAGINVNNSIIMPYAALQQISSSYSLNFALLRIEENKSIDEVKANIVNYFKKNFPTFTVNIQSAKELINSIAKQQAIFSLLLGLIGGISLLVGGIGVMNIMLASVSERHAEIGLRIALGASPHDVQIMFLLEAVTLAVIGGGLGVFIGILSTVTIAYFAHWNIVILIWPPAIGFGVSLLISLFFGFYPAYVASKLNPIETLRS